MICKGYSMDAQGYEFYLRIRLLVEVSLLSERSERMRVTLARGDKIHIPKRPCNVLFIL